MLPESFWGRIIYLFSNTVLLFKRVPEIPCGWLWSNTFWLYHWLYCRNHPDDSRGQKRDSTVKKIVLKIVKFILKIYVEVFRGTPMILQAMFIYYGVHICLTLICPCGLSAFLSYPSTPVHIWQKLSAAVFSQSIRDRQRAPRQSA